MSPTLPLPLPPQRSSAGNARRGDGAAVVPCDARAERRYARRASARVVEREQLAVAVTPPGRAWASHRPQVHCRRLDVRHVAPVMVAAWVRPYLRPMTHRSLSIALAVLALVPTLAGASAPHYRGVGLARLDVTAGAVTPSGGWLQTRSGEMRAVQLDGG